MAVPEEPVASDIFAPNGAEAREFDVMMQNADAQHKQEIKQMMQQAAQQAQNIQPANLPSQTPLQPAGSPIIANAQPITTPTLSVKPPIQVPNYQTQAQATNSKGPQQSQISPQEQALYDQILEQKHLQDLKPNPNTNHKVILLPGQTNKQIPKPIIQPANQTSTKAVQEQTNKVNNATIAQEAYAKKAPKKPQLILQSIGLNKSNHQTRLL